MITQNIWILWSSKGHILLSRPFKRKASRIKNCSDILERCFNMCFECIIKPSPVVLSTFAYTSGKYLNVQIGRAPSLIQAAKEPKHCKGSRFHPRPLASIFMAISTVIINCYSNIIMFLFYFVREGLCNL